MRYVLASALLAVSLVAPQARASDTTSTGHRKSLPDGAALHREAENVAAAQRAFTHRARMNSLASKGEWQADLEKKKAA